MGAAGRIWLAAVATGAGTFLPPRAAFPLVMAGAALAFRRRRAGAGVAGLVLLCAGAVALSAGARHPPSSAAAALADVRARCDVRGKVLEHAGGLGSLVAVDAATCQGFEPVERLGPVMARRIEADAGAAVSGRGWLVPLDPTDGFDRLRRRAGALAALETRGLEIESAPGGMLAAAARVRAGLRSAYDALAPRRAALLAGLTVGDTTGFDATTERNFRRAGLTHLVAVSGSNVAIVLGAVLVSCARLALWARAAAAAVALGFFVLVVGPEPSVLRAAAMGAIGLAALLAGRRPEPFHALGLAVIVVLALRPGMAGAPGLHLSVAATAGIVLWSPAVAAALRFIPRPVAAAVAVTCSAQAAVTPILVLTFGEMSVSSLLANVMAAPAVPPATILGFAAGVAGSFSDGLGFVPARAADPFLGWILWAGDIFGPPEWAVIAPPRFTGWVAGALLCALAARSRRGRVR